MTTVEAQAIAKNALAIWEGGACNPRAIARELVKAIDFACTNGSDEVRGQDGAAARIILAQLSHLMRASFDGIGGATSLCGDLGADLTRCRND